MLPWTSFSRLREVPLVHLKIAPFWGPPHTKGAGRAPFDGSVDEVALDIQKALALGCTSLTFDLPDPDVAGMVGTMKRFADQVEPGFCPA